MPESGCWTSARNTLGHQGTEIPPATCSHPQTNPQPAAAKSRGQPIRQLCSIRSFSNGASQPPGKPAASRRPTPPATTRRKPAASPVGNPRRQPPAIRDRLCGRHPLQLAANRRPAPPDKPAGNPRAALRATHPVNSQSVGSQPSPVSFLPPQSRGRERMVSLRNPWFCHQSFHLGQNLGFLRAPAG